MNYFAFETNVRSKIKELLEPVIGQQVDDRKVLAQTITLFNELSKRLDWVEGIFGEHKGKNVVFDEMQNKINIADAERVQFKAHITGQIEVMQQTQEHIVSRVNSMKDTLKT